VVAVHGGPPRELNTLDELVEVVADTDGGAICTSDGPAPDGDRGTTSISTSFSRSVIGDSRGSACRVAGAANVAVARAVDAALNLGVDQLYPFATSAIRDAVNRDQVVERIAQVAGVVPQFLSGEQEARLTNLAVHRWYGWSAGRILMLDIGGGSMESCLAATPSPRSRCRCRWARAG
jgi:Ppx/GppA phosphatase family